MAFKKEFQLFALTLLSVVVYIQCYPRIIPASNYYTGDTDYRERVFFDKQGTLVCDQITCPPETNGCYFLEIYGENNSTIRHENICFSKDNDILNPNSNITLPDIFYYNRAVEIVLRSNGSRRSTFKIGPREKRPYTDINKLKEESQNAWNIIDEEFDEWFKQAEQIINGSDERKQIKNY